MCTVPSACLVALAEYRLVQAGAHAASAALGAAHLQHPS